MEEFWRSSNTDDEDEEDAIGLFNIHAFQISQRSRLSKLNNYKMDHPNRGKAIIFNHNSFKNPHFAVRHGTEADVENLQKTLLKLGFQQEDIIVCNDLPFLEILNVLKRGNESCAVVTNFFFGAYLVYFKNIADLSEKICFKNSAHYMSSEDHENNDLLMVFVLTHGFNNDRIMAYDEDYPVEKIWSYFTADKCQTLAEKPKIFFIVACRGDSIDRGLSRQSKMVGLEEQSSTQVDAMAFQTSFSYVIPIWSDFLCVFSSFKGYYSYRNVVAGTWFVQAFCEQASKTNFNNVAFTDFLTGVNGQIARTFQTHPLDLRKQIPVISSTLTKLLYLKNKNPG